MYFGLSNWFLEEEINYFRRNLLTGPIIYGFGISIYWVFIKPAMKEQHDQKEQPKQSSRDSRQFYNLAELCVIAILLRQNFPTHS